MQANNGVLILEPSRGKWAGSRLFPIAVPVNAHRVFGSYEILSHTAALLTQTDSGGGALDGRGLGGLERSDAGAFERNGQAVRGVYANAMAHEVFGVVGQPDRAPSDCTARGYLCFSQSSANSARSAGSILPLASKSYPRQASGVGQSALQ